MTSPPAPTNESERLEELSRFEVLDSLPEEAYDAITLLASHICDTPIALISLIDETRQWFKSRVGIEATSTSRDVAFCSYAILEPDEILVVPDAVADPRFSRNPLVVDDPSIRFYAGAPLVTDRGHALGTLCVIDRTPRELTESQEEALRALSTQVMTLLENRWTLMELERTQQDLEEAIKQKETFVATVSHEIRTPLSAVVGYIDLLADPSFEVSEDERASVLTTISHQASEVSNIIDDLLVEAKAKSGTLRVQCVDVNLAAQTAQVVEGIESDLVARVEVDIEACRATGDPARVRQIIRNLLTNAFRYGGPDVSITGRRIGDRCQLDVWDNGDGIAQDALVTLFEPFQQSVTGPVVSGSVGLGLSISRFLAELMGGSLTYLRQRDRTVFRLELPASTRQENAAPTKETSPVGLSAP